MEKEGSVVKLDSAQNFRKSTFEFCGTSYELAISLYTNAVFIIITSNGKIGNVYVMEIDEEDQEEIIIKDELIEDGEGNYNEAPRIESADCVLGDRRNEKNQFICDFILSYISKQIIKKTKSIEKLIFSITLSPSEYLESDFELTQHNKELIEVIKFNISQLLNI